MRVETHVHYVPDGRVVETHFEGGVVGEYVAVDLSSSALLQNKQELKRLERGGRRTGKKFAATLLLTVVKGELISCGYQNVSFPFPVVIFGYVELSFFTLPARPGRYFCTLCRARKEFDSWLSP
jgi:hypothetical protein